MLVSPPAVSAARASPEKVFQPLSAVTPATGRALGKDFAARQAS